MMLIEYTNWQSQSSTIKYGQDNVGASQPVVFKLGFILPKDVVGEKD